MYLLPEFVKGNIRLPLHPHTKPDSSSCLEALPEQKNIGMGLGDIQKQPVCVCIALKCLINSSQSPPRPRGSNLFRMGSVQGNVPPIPVGHVIWDMES